MYHSSDEPTLYGISRPERKVVVTLISDVSASVLPQNIGSVLTGDLLE